MASTRPYAVMRDKYNRLELDGKSIRGVNGARVYTRTAQFFSHFLDLTVANLGFSTGKTDGGGTAGTVLARDSASLRGTATMVPSADTSGTGTTATTPGGLAFAPATEATTKPLVFETRLKFGSVTAAEYSFGFKDAAGSDASDITYAVSTTSTLGTSVPNDGAAFAWSSVPTSGALFSSGHNYVAALASKAGTDSINALTSYASGTNITLTSFHVYRIEVDVNGNAFFFIDDVFVKYVGAALTAANPLTGYFNAIQRATSGSKSIVVDYVLVAAGA